MWGGGGLSAEALDSKIARWSRWASPAAKSGLGMADSGVTAVPSRNYTYHLLFPLDLAVLFAVVA
jgi:hypothetical protein